MPRSTVIVGEARARADEMVAVSREAFVDLSRAYSEAPADKRVAAVLTRTVIDLDRNLRLRDSLRRR